ncbi:FCGBP protein, partial [Trogon melanurus]|nr:FCGBP protein [Trogon melanurus]
ACEVADGRAACVPAAVSTCRAGGNVHYRTFGGKNFVFAGGCTYTLAKPCRPDPALPAFAVEATNERRGDPEVAAIVSVAVRVYGVTVEAVKAETGIVRVNNRRSHLPVSLANGKLRLLQKGGALLLTADFGLKVSYDWDDRVVLKLPAALASQACGACSE